MVSTYVLVEACFVYRLLPLSCGCGEKSVTQAYYTLCHKCAEARLACAKCGESVGVAEVAEVSAWAHWLSNMGPFSLSLFSPPSSCCKQSERAHVYLCHFQLAHTDVAITTGDMYGQQP